MQSSVLVQQMWSHKVQWLGGSFSIQQIHITNHNVTVNVGLPSAAHTHEKCVPQLKCAYYSLDAHNDLVYSLYFVCSKQKA